MGKSISLYLDGTLYDQWETGEVERDLKDFSGRFSFTFRDAPRSADVLPFASMGAVKRLAPQMEAKIMIGRRVVLRGYVETVNPDMRDGQATVQISGRDKTGDLIDCAALVDGPAELKNVKLEDAVKKIAEPYGLTVKSEVDTGEVFDRYSIDLGETAFSAIEKGTRSRRVLVLSDGVGGIVITRTGKSKAPADLTLPGNVLSSSATFSTEGRHSKTVVRGQSERAGKSRKAASLEASAAPLTERAEGNGSARDAERKGTVATGTATDDEIKRYRPVVHLARSKADAKAATDEADWRNRTARAKAEEYTHSVKGHTVDGTLWMVNQLVTVSDVWLEVYRDLLISKVKFSESSSGATTEMTTCSPEAFDTEDTGKRRTNKRGKKASKSSGPLDSTAKAL
ncbi:prophage tail gpP-like protein [Agrobacterium vitis]|nr:prophage tail gpP-like protein [Agrobacterium vitis]MBE1440545.1 prophage tail gpP-like protein [Agrobacterium vitis]